MKLCSYCNKKGKITKEHVIPKFIYKRTNYKDGQINLRKRDFDPSEFIIKDVCEKCNSGALSELDTKMTKLYDTKLCKFVEKGEDVSFEYNYDDICRWLLKVAFNCQRQKFKEYNQFYSRNLINYILCGGKIPTDIRIFIKLIVPYNLNKEEQKKITYIKKIYPAAFDISTLSDDKYNAIGKQILINSYCFYIFVRNKAVYNEDEWKEIIEKSKDRFDLNTELNTNSKPIEIKSSETTYLDLKRDFHIETADIYYKNKDRLLKELTT